MMLVDSWLADFFLLISLVNICCRCLELAFNFIRAKCVNSGLLKSLSSKMVDSKIVDSFFLKYVLSCKHFLGKLALMSLAICFNIMSSTSLSVKQLLQDTIEQRTARYDQLILSFCTLGCLTIVVWVLKNNNTEKYFWTCKTTDNSCYSTWVRSNILLFKKNFRRW